MKTNIYLIDDDPIFVFLAKKIISIADLGAKINEFSDGQKAIEYIKKHIDDADILPDVISLDLNMGIMDGWGFLEEYILIEPEIKKSIKLYIVSSSISPYDIERAAKFSVVTDFILKPMDKDKIIAMATGHASHMPHGKPN